MNLYANRYEKLGYLGKGVTGEVHRARDSKTGQDCALKILHSPLNRVKKAVLDGFKREFEVLKNINHPSIAKVLDVGLNTETNRIFLVTEYVNGKDLFEVTENHSIDLIEAVFVQALRALNYLHNQKIYHLDIKPQNLLVGVDEQTNPVLKIIDFGFANFYEGQLSGKSENWVIVGTAPYVAPEIIRGEPHDGRADLYSLGCAFYKAFARVAPFKGVTIEEVHEKHLSVVPQKPSSINPQIPEYLDKVLLKLLAKDVAHRYATAREVIDDLNLLSGKSYQIETASTLTSYLPEKGKLIGRDAEFKTFQAIYSDRLYTEQLKRKPYLIIKADTGCGKTRFLQECKNEAHKNFLKTLSWDELDKLSIEEVPTPCLVLGDDAKFDSYDIDYLTVAFEKLPFLAILTMTGDTSAYDAENIIELKNFTREQTQEYLLKATGLACMPASIVEIIHHRTSGNPLYITEYVRALFEKGFFIDEQGTWSEKIIEDLGSELTSMGAEEFIKKNLLAKVDALKLDAASLELLNILALTGKPTLHELEEMTDGHLIDERLKKLVTYGLIAVGSEDAYVFTNPLFKEIFLDKMDTATLAILCDGIADHYESAGAQKEQVLFFRGRGKTSKANSSLLELAQIKKAQCLHEATYELLKTLLNRKLDKNTRQEILLEIGGLCNEMGRYEEAQKWLESVSQQSEGDTINIISIKALDQIGLSFKRRHLFTEARHYYKLGLVKLLNVGPELKWLQVILKNKLAQIEFDLGNTTLAETIFTDTWQIWENDLNDKEKMLAIGNDIDSIYYIKGEYEKAIHCLERHLEVLSKKPNNDSYPLTLYKLARTHLQLGQAEKGEQLLQQLIIVLKDRKIPHYLYAAYNELGNLCAKRDDLSSALSYYKHAFALAGKKGGNFYLVSIVYNIANTHLKMDHLDDAKKYFEFTIKSIELSKNNDDLQAASHLFTSLLGLAAIHRKKNKFNEAQGCLQKAIQLLNEKNYLNFYGQYFWQEKAELENQIGNKAELKNCMNMLDSLKTKAGFNSVDYENWVKTALQVTE